VVASSAINEGLLRQILVGHAELKEQVAGLGATVESVKADAREARDAARESAAATKAQDLPAKIAELKGQVEKMAEGNRADLVNAISRVTAEVREGKADHGARLDAHDIRLDKLEAGHNRFKGATGLIGWISRNMPWLMTALVAAAAIFDMKDRHP
jgi:outer membrane murein-binding lipoprotein Lpp